jgi:hypothetical protein
VLGRLVKMEGIALKLPYSAIIIDQIEFAEEVLWVFAVDSRVVIVRYFAYDVIIVSYKAEIVLQRLVLFVLYILKIDRRLKALAAVFERKLPVRLFLIGKFVLLLLL